MEERRENENLKLEYLLHWPAFLAGLAGWYPGNAAAGGWETPWMGKKAGEKVLCDQLEMEAERREGMPRLWPATQR